MGTDDFNENDLNNDSENNDDNEVKPVKLGRLATTAICIVGVIIVVIILLTVKSCSVEKVENTSQQNEVENSSVSSVSEISLNSSENNQNFEDSSAILVESSSTSVENSISDNIESSQELNSNLTSNVVSDDFNEVVLPELSDDIETTGIVLSKKSYLYKGSYVYGVSISMLVGEGTVNCQYFCPKNTFDALTSAESITVVYQTDSNGSVSIKSIMK